MIPWRTGQEVTLHSPPHLSAFFSLKKTVGHLLPKECVGLASMGVFLMASTTTSLHVGFQRVPFALKSHHNFLFAHGAAGAFQMSAGDENLQPLKLFPGLLEEGAAPAEEKLTRNH